MRNGEDDARRPMQISRDEEALRWMLLDGKITREQFDKKLEELKNGTAETA